MATSRQLDKDILAGSEHARRLAFRSVTLRGGTIYEVRQGREGGCTLHGRMEGGDKGYGGVYKLADMGLEGGGGGFRKLPFEN